MTMRLLLISGDFPPVQSGEANHAYFLSKELARAGCDVHVLTSRIKNVRRDSDYQVYPLMRSWSWLELGRFRRFVRRFAPDAVLLLFLGDLYRHHPMMTFAPTVAHSVCPGVRFVTQFENVHVNIYGAPSWTRLGRKLMARWAGQRGVDYEYGTLLRDSDALIVLSNMHKDRLAEHDRVVHDKARLIPPPPLMCVAPRCAAKRTQTRAALGVAVDDFLVLSYGYIYKGKGFETLFAALKELGDAKERVRLLVVGGHVEHSPHPGQAAASKRYLEAMKEQSRALGIADRVHWYGPVAGDSETASNLLHAADACVLPFEAGIQLNNSSFAAAATHGLPVVATRAAATEAVFCHEENILLCPPKAPVDLAAALRRMLDQPELRERLAQGVKALADEWFSWPGAAERIIATLRSPATSTALPAPQHANYQSPFLRESQVQSPFEAIIKKGP